MGIVMNRAQFIDATEPFLNRAFDGSYRRYPKQYDKVFDVETARPSRFEEDYVVAGLGLAVEKPEGTAITYDNGEIAYRVRFVHKTYGLAFAITEELEEDSETLRVGSMMSADLGRSMVETEEIVAADVLNRAETSGYVGGDGQVLLSTAHPLAGGGTFSNKLSSPADLSEASLEQLVIQMKRAKDERGKPIVLRATQIVVAPENVFNATRILKSTMQPGNNYNDPNALRVTGLVPTEAFEMTRLTLTDAYFIKTDAPRGLLFKRRRPVTRGVEADFETGSTRFKATSRFSCGFVDPRCCFGSLGV
jgi:hypothetical protein